MEAEIYMACYGKMGTTHTNVNSLQIAPLNLSDVQYITVCEVEFSIKPAYVHSQLTVTTETEMCHNVLARRCSHLTFSLMLHVDGRSAQTADTGTQHRRTWIVSELMARGACGPM